MIFLLALNLHYRKLKTKSSAKYRNDWGGVSFDLCLHVTEK